jgi:hypothetical protein
MRTASGVVAVDAEVPLVLLVPPLWFGLGVVLGAPDALPRRWWDEDDEEDDDGALALRRCVDGEGADEGDGSARNAAGLGATMPDADAGAPKASLESSPKNRRSSSHCAPAKKDDDEDDEDENDEEDKDDSTM